MSTPKYIKVNGHVYRLAGKLGSAPDFTSPIIQALRASDGKQQAVALVKKETTASAKYIRFKGAVYVKADQPVRWGPDRRWPSDEYLQHLISLGDHPPMTKKEYEDLWRKRSILDQQVAAARWDDNSDPWGRMDLEQEAQKLNELTLKVNNWLDSRWRAAPK